MTGDLGLPNQRAKMAPSFGHFFGRIFRIPLSRTLYPAVRVKRFYRTKCTPGCCRRGDGRSERDYTKLVLFCHAVYDQGIATEKRWQGINTCPPGRDAEKIRPNRKKGRKRWKFDGVRSGEYGGCGKTRKPRDSRVSLVTFAVWGAALL